MKGRALYDLLDRHLGHHEPSRSLSQSAIAVSCPMQEMYFGRKVGEMRRKYEGGT